MLNFMSSFTAMIGLICLPNPLGVAVSCGLLVIGLHRAKKQAQDLNVGKAFMAGQFNRNY
jgi:hypothetical protein